MNKKSAMDEGSSKKRYRFPLEDNEEFVSEAEDTRTQAATTIITTTDTSNSQISTVTITQQSSSQNIQRNRRPFSEVWDYFVKGTEKNNGHYEATCSYYDISCYWHEKVAERNINYTRRSKKSCVLPNSMLQATITSHYMSDRPLSKTINNRLDQKIIKAWILADHGESITNTEVSNLISNESFFTTCRFVRSNLGHTRSEGEELIAQLRRFEARLPPFDLPYVANMDTPKIWWVSSENSLGSIVSDHSTTLLIEDIVDLTVGNNSEHSTKTAQTISPADLDYNPLDVLNGFLERENQNNSQ
ncbi:15171_t:CDS:2 [Cetraspora pellucida]|uniref:15171_t:CDS:1 n=1 Tax=Cetraspora pellucida TaxID=1433469 RepID=A0A9N9DZV5_9GLOM|nr:15171_t:CDS:2 [Cetraspora pellucida]